MSAANVQVAPDSTGKKIQTFENTVGSDAVEAQAIVRVKSDGTTLEPSSFANLGANATLNVKASAGTVFSVSCFNANAASRYLQLHNTATTPSASDPPAFTFLVPTGSQIVIGADFFTENGAAFATGIAFAFSTARNIYTAGTASDQTTFIQYK